MSDIDDMVNGFVDGVSASVANLEFTLTKEQLDKIKQTFKPLQFEDYLSFEFMSSGKIVVSSFDKGITAWTELSTTEMDLRGEEYQCFFIDTKRINKLADVCQGAIKFTVCDGEMKVKIGQNDLHISLPMYELVTNVSFTPQNSETKHSDEVSMLASRCQASKGSGTFMIPTMSLGKNWYYGTTQSVSIVSGGFENLDVRVRPDFLDFIANLPFTKEPISFAHGIDSDESPMFCISSDNVYYKTALIDQEFEDVDALFTEAADCELTFSTLETISDLSILSIPLVGMDNASFTLIVNEAPQIDISVTDEGNRTSKSQWKASDVTGSFEASLGISAYLNAVNAMSKEGIKLESRESTVILSDSQQKVVLIKYM